MRLMLHTFMKDARRLWPAVAVTWLMLAVVANADRWRADWVPRPMEGWMNLLLSMAWACVAALAVQEEPLVGDRNFWTTRPHRWPALLGAKLVFVVLAIHVPSFIADLYILAARGFSPGEYLGVLLLKQLLFLCALTLPAIALAAVVRNFTHFVLGVFVIAAGIAMMKGGFQNYPDYSREVHGLRHAVVLGVLALAAAVIVLVQYARRRAPVARVLAVAAAFTAGSVSAYMPSRVEYAMGGGSGPAAPTVTLRQAVPDDAMRHSAISLPRRLVLIPVTIDSAGRAGLFHPVTPDVEIVAANGVRIRSVRITPNDPAQKLPLVANFRRTDWLMLEFSSAEWERVKNGRVDLAGSVGLQFYRKGETTTMPALGSRDVPDVGKCTGSLAEDRYSENMLKLLCESPGDLPITLIRLFHTQSGREWKNGLQLSGMYSSGPQDTFLSPLKRAQTFFRLTEEIAMHPGAQYVVPREYLPTVQIEITPEITTGVALAHFEFKNLNLQDYLAK